MKFATKLRLILWLSIALMLTPTVLLMTGVLNRPLMFEGDQLEERVCPDCGGKGCPTCAKSGKARYLIPGPHRPTRWMGLILDSTRPWSGAPPPPPLPEKPPGQGVHPAAIKFISSDGIEVPLETNPEGRFAIDLPPGKFRIELAVPGKPLWKGEIEVTRLTEPVRYDGAMKPTAFTERPLLFDVARGIMEPGNPAAAAPEAGESSPSTPSTPSR